MEIEKDLLDIEILLENNLILKIIAPTSSGKTVSLPKYLGKKYKVSVIVSNDKTAKSLNSLNFPNVNYIYSKDYKKIRNEDILIIDEMDTASFDIFFIISLWEKNKKTKLILNSNLPHSLFPQFPTYIVKKYISYPSEIRYLKDFDNFNSSITPLINLVYKSHNSSIEGDFLIFGLREKSVNVIIERLKKIIDADIYSSYNITSDIYKSSNKRKIVVCGSLGKTSITLNNIGCIFDLMREKRLVPTLAGGYIDKVEYISQRDAELRSNRSNRSCIVYRMISEKTFLELPEFTDELIYRIPLHHLMIDIYDRGLKPFEIFFNF